MTKELEALKDLEIIREALLNYRNKVEEVKVGCIVSPQFASIRQSLLELQAIKEAEPSKALQCLTGLEKEIIQRDGYIGAFLKIKFDNIKQALLKAEKLEKAWNIIKNKCVDIYLLKSVNEVEKYNKLIGLRGIELTEEEFELLKEMTK